MADPGRDALDRYWDGFATGRVDDPVDLDPTLVEAVRRLHAASDVDGPTHDFVTRLQEDLMLTDVAALPRPTSLDPLVVPNGFVRSSRDMRADPSSLPDRRSGWLPPLLIAAMILLTVGLGYRVLTSGDGDTSRLGGVPAPLVDGRDPLPEGVTDAEVLVEVLVPEGVIAAGERTDLALMLDTIPPGTVRKSGLDQTGCCPGLNVNLVLTGTATVRADGPMQLVPSAGSLELVMITPGTDIVIGPGDTLVYRQETAWEWTVSESGPMSLLWGVAYGGIFSPSVNMGFGHPEDNHLLSDVTLPASGYPIRLWRATLDPGASLRPEPGVSQLMVTDPAADARIGEQSGNAFKNLGAQPVSIYLMSAGVATPGATDTAAVGTTPDAAVTDQETLVELTLPADTLSASTTTEVGLGIYAVPAGSTTVWTGTDGGCCPGQSFMHILEGTSTFQANGPTHFLRAGKGTMPEVVAAGVEVSLTPGDTILVREEFEWEWTVAGDSPMRLLSGWMIQGSSLPSPDLANWVTEDREIVYVGPTMTAEPITLRLRQLTVEAGATLSPDAAVVQVAVASAAEGARFAQQSDYGLRNLGEKPARLYVASLSPADPSAEVVVAGISATPAPAGATTLVEVALPADILPSGAEGSVTTAIFTIPAGASVPLSRTSGSSGLNMTIILEGAATFRADVDVDAFLIPAGGVPEPSPSNVDVTLQVGDAVVHREGSDWQLIPAGEGPTIILSSWIVEGVSIQIDLSNWAYSYDDLDSANRLTLPTGPYTFRFQRVALDPDETLPPDAAFVQLAVAPLADQVQISRSSDNTLRNASQERETIYVVTLGPADPDGEVVVAGLPATPVATPAR